MMDELFGTSDNESDEERRNVEKVSSPKCSMLVMESVFLALDIRKHITMWCPKQAG